MLLQRLYELRQRLTREDVPPAYYREQPIKWLIQLDSDGRYLGWIPAGDDPKGLLCQSPYISRSGQRPPPFLLVDKHDYLLGAKFSKDLDKSSEAKREKEQDKATQRHAMFRGLLDALFEEIEQGEQEFPETLEAIRFFYQDEQHLRVAKDLEKWSAEGRFVLGVGDLVGFLVDGVFPHELPAVQTFWQRLQDARAEEGARIERECMLSGVPAKIALTHPIEFPIGPERTKLVTANNAAFLSYGLKQSEIAPMSIQAARAYGESLRYLLTSTKHHLRIGATSYVFWTRNATDFDFAAFLTEPDASQVRALFEGVFSGKEIGVVEDDFYAAALSSQKARLVVRDYLETTLRSVKASLAAWFEAQKMRSAATGAFGEALAVTQLAGALVRRDPKTRTYKWEQLAPQIVPSLLKRALFGTPLPAYLLMQLMRRFRAESSAPLNYPRAVLLKLVLNDQMTLSTTSDSQKEANVTSELNPQEHRPAYLCGRLFALLEGLQRQALGNVQSTIADRFFGTASSAPASVFGRLLRGSQAHLQKLRKDPQKRGAYFGIEREIEEILVGLGDFPKVLNLQDQGLFAIGYYHQRAAARQAIQSAQASKSGQGQEEESPAE